MTDPRDPRRAVAEVARASYERLLAFLASRSRDLAASEDALADALYEALERWPVSGVPNSPEAWLLTVARRRLIDAARRNGTEEAAFDDLRAAYEDAAALASTPQPFPDDRLKLLFVCAHPAIPAEIHTPLMLHVVLGLDAARIGSAFLVAPTTMGQRLFRAKAKIRDTRISFDVPEQKELEPRLEAVLAAVYAAYGVARDGVGSDTGAANLRAEAVTLARMLAAFLPDESEVLGLLAVLLHCEARDPARRTTAGAYVRLSEQDTALWDQALREQADTALREGSRAEKLGRFLFEAAIQSVHARRAETGTTDWAAVALLYGALLCVAPTIGAAVAHAAAVLEAHNGAAALPLLDAIAPDDVAAYQPYWAVRASVLGRTGRVEEACSAYERAIGLSADPAVRGFLRGEMETLRGGAAYAGSMTAPSRRRTPRRRRGSRRPRRSRLSVRRR
ncbi:MAG: polymerase sigma-70 factor, subfamily protein [Myxococcaceae bacterium]|nr:polymerase sigma-70 factor, subfamily protein [Myxococcaceae bacterium]